MNVYKGCIGTEILQQHKRVENKNFSLFCNTMQDPVIVALATAPAPAALHTIRLSGSGCIQMVERIFKGKKISTFTKNSLCYGQIIDNQTLIDEVMLSVFIAPHSFTKEDSVEITCHGSPFISNQIIELLIKQGAVPAKAGEFTQRAFLQGRFDLAQAEAVADLIHAESEEARKLAFQQLKGGVSSKIAEIRETILTFLALLELELDFGEEDVEFANRTQLLSLLNTASTYITTLIQSFKSGNAIKKGIPLVIAGKPNVGKSTLLNCLLNEDRAIVSDIPGTTRDTIEEQFLFNGLLFKLIDTAGIRSDTDSKIESLGIEKTFEKLQQAAIIIYLIDAANLDELMVQKEKLNAFEEKILWVVNKKDLLNEASLPDNTVLISAKQGDIDALLTLLKSYTDTHYLNQDISITNTRHLHALQSSLACLNKAKQGIENNVSSEWIVFELKNALEDLGTITGKIQNEEVLGAIFSKFCIGK